MKQLKTVGKLLFVAFLLTCNPSTQALANSSSDNNIDNIENNHYEEYIAGGFTVIEQYNIKSEKVVIAINSIVDALPDSIDTSSGKVKALKKSVNENYIQDYSKKEIATLERIVEAEAEGEGIIGKILVANVVLNRVRHDEFPDTIRKVVFQENQFEPVGSGRYYDVTVSDETKEAIEHVIERGIDYSRGALYFHGSYFGGWSSLSKLFTYKGHTFYIN